MSGKTRDSNIELLRIICIVLLIAHHLAIHGGLVISCDGGSRLFAKAFFPVGKIAFDTFLAISTWFMVEASFKPKKFISMWLQVLFYNVVFTIATIMIRYERLSYGGMRALVGSFFPILGNSHGFASTYLLFLLIVPLLKVIINHLEKKIIYFVTVLLFCIQVLSAPIGVLIGYAQPYRSELLLFVLFYFVSYCLKNYNSQKVDIGLHKKRIIFIVVISLSYMAAYIPYFPNDESSIFNIFGGYAFFFLARSITVRTSKIINGIAETTFGILLFHDHNVFRNTLWHLVGTEKWSTYSLVSFIANYLGAVVIIFIIGMLIEIIRKKAIDNLIMQTMPVKRISEKLNLIYREEVKHE